MARMRARDKIQKAGIGSDGPRLARRGGKRVGSSILASTKPD
jgi:hypothetical protein